MRVLFVASEPPETATYRYRSENLARCLRRAGHNAEVVYVGDSRVRVAADVVVLHRVCTVPEGLAFVRAARATGAVLVYSADDSVFDADSFPSDGEPWTAIRAFAPRHAAMVAEADAVLTSTEYLAGRVGRLFGAHKPVFTVRNFLGDELLRLSETAGGSGHDAQFVTLGYLSGSATHNADFAVIARDVREVLMSHDNTRLLLVGTVEISSHFEELAQFGKLIRVPFTPWRDLPRLLTRTDINLSPLDLRHGFVRGKSEIKCLEAAVAGVPTIATATEGYTESVPPDAVAYCHDNRGWRDTLESLLDENARRALSERAYIHTLTHGTEEAQTAHVARVFEAIAALSRPGNGDTERGGAGAWVNYPFAPAKYLAKAILRRLKT